MENGLEFVIITNYLYKVMRLLKLNGFIHIYTSISWDINSNEIIYLLI